MTDDASSGTTPEKRSDIAPAEVQKTNRIDTASPTNSGDNASADSPGDVASEAADDNGSISAAKKRQLMGIGVVVGASLANFISVGVVNTFGIIYRAQQTSPSSDFRDVSAFRLGFVTGIAAGFTFLAGPFSNVLTTRLGIRFPVGLGVLLMTVALELGSLATEFWQLLLSQGVLWGIGSSLVFIPAIGLPSQWFDKRRGIATGVASAGAPIGAMILSPSIEAIIGGVSLQWALRALGFIILGIGVLVTMLLRAKPLVAPRPSPGEKSGSMSKAAPTQYKFLDASIFKVKGFPLYMFVAFLQMFAYATPTFWLPNYARAIGLSPLQGSNIIVVLNAGNFLGRLVAGQGADVLGVLNVLSTSLFVAGLLCVIGWLFCTTFAQLAAFSFFWGFFAGGYWALTVPAAGRIVGMQRIGSAASINFLMNVVPPIFAAPIGAQLNNATARKLGVDATSLPAFRYLIVWSGLTYMVSGLLTGVVRFMLVRKPLAKV